jgi:hypothetical protein
MLELAKRRAAEEEERRVERELLAKAERDQQERLAAEREEQLQLEEEEWNRLAEEEVAKRKAGEVIWKHGLGEGDSFTRATPEVDVEMEEVEVGKGANVEAQDGGEMERGEDGADDGDVGMGTSVEAVEEAANVS